MKSKKRIKIISDVKLQYNMVRNKDITELRKYLKSKQISSAGNYNEMKNKVKIYFNNQIEINEKDVDQNRQFIQDVTGRESVKKG